MKVLTTTTAKFVLAEMYRTGKSHTEICDEQNLWEITDRAEIERIVDQVIKDNPKAVADYRGRP